MEIPKCSVYNSKKISLMVKKLSCFPVLFVTMGFHGLARRGHMWNYAAAKQDKLSKVPNTQSNPTVSAV